MYDCISIVIVIFVCFLFVFSLLIFIDSFCHVGPKYRKLWIINQLFHDHSLLLMDIDLYHYHQFCDEGVSKRVSYMHH